MENLNKIALDAFNGKLKNGDIPKELFDFNYSRLLEAVDDGFGQIKYGEPNYEFNQELKHNAAVFTAFKNHQQTGAIVEALTDENGNQRSKSEFLKAAKKISKTYNEQYLEVEHFNATRAARSAALFKDAEATKDVYENLEYLPSRSANPRKEHKVYYGIIKPVDDPIWDTIMPPNGHFCDCGVRKTRKEATTEEVEPLKPVPGIVGNPGKSGKLFSSSHPYVTNTSKSGKQNVKKKLETLERDYIKTAAKDFADKKLTAKKFKNAAFEKQLSISKKSAKQLIENDHKHYNEKNLLVYDLDIVVASAELVSSVEGENNTLHYLKFKLKKENSYVLVKEVKGKFYIQSILDKDQYNG